MAGNLTIPHTFIQDENSSAPDVNDNFDEIADWVNTNAVHLDGSKAFTGVPSGPTGTDPTAADHLARKGYVDTQVSAEATARAAADTAEATTRAAADTTLTTAAAAAQTTANTAVTNAATAQAKANAAAEGVLAAVSFASNLGTSGAAGEVTLLAAQATLVSTRMYKITFSWPHSTGSGGATYIVLKEDSTVIGTFLINTGSGLTPGGSVCVLRGTGLSGTKTYSAVLSTAAPGGAAIDSSPAGFVTWLFIEDLGAV